LRFFCASQYAVVFAEFETNIRRERQLEGIARTKAEGVYKGRRRAIDPAEVQGLAASGMGATEVARSLKVSRASVYRLLKGAAAS